MENIWELLVLDLASRVSVRLQVASKVKVVILNLVQVHENHFKHIVIRCWKKLKRLKIQNILLKHITKSTDRKVEVTKLSNNYQKRLQSSNNFSKANNRFQQELKVVLRYLIRNLLFLWVQEHKVQRMLLEEQNLIHRCHWALNIVQGWVRPSNMTLKLSQMG